MLVIFDLDGTLLNTIDDLADAANHALRVCGFEPRSIEECRRFVGNGVTKLLERALPETARTPQHIANMRAAFVSYYNEHLMDKTHPYTEIETLLSQLQARGIKLAVCSNKYQYATEGLIHHFFAKIQFVAVVGQRENIPLKPHPQVVEEILHITQESKTNCLYVGDSDTDAQTAQNAGVKFCAVTWGFRPRRILEEYNPAYLVNSPIDILMLPEIQTDNYGA